MFTTALAAALLSGGAGPIDFAKVPRALVEQPTYVAAPRYGLFLFGEDADVRVWAVLDKSDAEGGHYDVLYVDLDADGTLGEEGERFAAEVVKNTRGDSCKFTIGDFAQPKSELVHEDFTLTWREASVSFRMLWCGEKVTMGAYGPRRETYASFGESLEDAPIYVPGYDRPFQFEHWMSGTLKSGETTDFKVFVGNRGSKQGTFTCVDDEFLPKDEYALATLIYRDAAGAEKRVQAKLTERC